MCEPADDVHLHHGLLRLEAEVGRWGLWDTRPQSHTDPGRAEVRPRGVWPFGRQLGSPDCGPREHALCRPGTEAMGSHPP